MIHRSTSRWSQFSAAAVHLYTASGAVLAFLMVQAAIQGNAVQALWISLITLIVDGTDGSLARRFRVSEMLPWFDGRRLDDIVDYLTYVFAPILLIWQLGVWKTLDYFFRRSLADRPHLQINRLFALALLIYAGKTLRPYGTIDDVARNQHGAERSKVACRSAVRAPDQRIELPATASNGSCEGLADKARAAGKKDAHTAPAVGWRAQCAAAPDCCLPEVPHL